MSKLAQAITATITNERVVSQKMPQNYSVEFKTQKVGSYAQGGIKTAYDIGVKFNKRAYVDESSTSTSNIDIHYEMIKHIRRAMIEEVFGEFRPYLIGMRSALYDRDDTRMRTLIAELEEKMFVEGL